MDLSIINSMNNAENNKKAREASDIYEQQIMKPEVNFKEGALQYMTMLNNMELGIKTLLPVAETIKDKMNKWALNKNIDLSQDKVLVSNLSRFSTIIADIKRECAANVEYINKSIQESYDKENKIMLWFLNVFSNLLQLIYHFRESKEIVYANSILKLIEEVRRAVELLKESLSQ